LGDDVGDLFEGNSLWGVLGMKGFYGKEDGGLEDEGST